MAAAATQQRVCCKLDSKHASGEGTVPLPPPHTHACTHVFATNTGSFFGKSTSSTPLSDSHGYCSPMLAAWGWMESVR